MKKPFEGYAPKRYYQSLENAESMNQKIQTIYSNLCDPDDPTMANRPIYTPACVFYGENSYRYTDESIKNLQNRIAGDLSKIQKVQTRINTISPIIEAATERFLKAHKLSLGIYYETGLLLVVLKRPDRPSHINSDFALPIDQALSKSETDLKKEIIMRIRELL